MALVQKEIKKVYLGNTLIRPTWWDMNNWELSQTSSGLSWQRWGWIFFNPNGTKIYLSCAAYDRIYESDLSHPYDLSNISFSKYLNLHTEDLHFSPDGVYMYLLDNNSSYIYRYTLSTPWDISTAVQDQSTPTVNLRWLFFTNDGTRFYTSSQYGNAIYMNTLSTPWDLTTASSMQTVTTNYGWLGIWFSPDWKYYFGQQDEYTYDLTYLEFSTPYDFNTVVDSWTKNIWRCRAWWIWFDNNGIMCVMVWWWYNTNYVTKYTL